MKFKNIDMVFGFHSEEGSYIRIQVINTENILEGINRFVKYTRYKDTINYSPFTCVSFGKETLENLIQALEQVQIELENNEKQEEKNE